MRAIKQSFSIIVLGLSSVAFSGATPADNRVTLIYSSGGYADYPYAVSHRYYQPRHSYRDHVCALPYRGHRHAYDRHHKHDKKSRHADSHWIDRRGYHHNDRHDKHRYSKRDHRDGHERYRSHDRHEKRRHPDSRMKVTRTHTAFGNRGDRY